jgi:methylglutamate dehydrogenase subunit C
MSARLPQGGRIDRRRPLSFRFDGKAYAGFAGDTLASALVASGVKLLGRSFKYHRPRGLLSAGPEEPNALVELRTGARREPNIRATQVELYDGLEAASQNRWPSLAFDLRAANGWLAPILKAGFYYKTFMWPASFWEKVYEPLIRRAAGLGRASGVEDPDAYERTTHHCDVLVIGAGPAGLTAALAAARAGARVTLCEQDFELGGRLLCERMHVDGLDGADWADRAVAELANYPDATVLRRTTVFGAYDHGTFGAVEQVADNLVEPPAFVPRQRLWRIRAKHAVLATGAIERPLVFGDNDLPGVMLSGAVRTYANRFAALPGRRVCVFATGDEAERTIEDLRRAGAAIAAIVDPRDRSGPGMREAAARADAPLYEQTAVLRALGSKWGVTGARLGGAMGERDIACDLIAMSGGWNPTVHLASHTGAKPVWNPQISAFVPDALPRGMRVAGAASGRWSLEFCLADGAAAGLAAARDAGFSGAAMAPPTADAEPAAHAPLWRVRGGGGKAFVDFQNDVTDADVELAGREGYSSVELMKRYTTLGMATDQGKTANVTGLALMAEITGKSIAATGTTTFRPPYTPVAIAAFAGHARGKHFRPTRRAPTHEWSRAHGAVFVEAGAWLRAQYYPRPGEGDWLAAASREAANVRANAGFCDVSTLGKIDVQGAGAGAFLDFVYANTISTLPIGKARYGLMLREDGFVFDDGTVSRLAENRWFVTTTTANAARVLQHMEHCLAIVKPGLAVRVCSATDQWAQIALAGPRAREVLARLAGAQAASDEALPYLGVRRALLAGGVDCWLYRLSFSGELAYEIGVPARYGDWLMAALARAGEDFGIMPYGTEALTMLRVEKGHPAGGELNGQTTASDLGMAKLLSTKKDFIGRVLSGRPALVDPARPILVGFAPEDGKSVVGGGAHFFDEDAAISIANDLGYATTATYSPAMGHWIGLGLLKDGRARIGRIIRAYDPVRGRDTKVRVCEPCFVDPKGERLRG